MPRLDRRVWGALVLEEADSAAGSVGRIARTTVPRLDQLEPPHAQAIDMVVDYVEDDGDAMSMGLIDDGEEDPGVK